MLLHPQIIEKSGKKEFVVIPYKEFLKIQEVQEVLEDFEDIRELRKEKMKSKGLPSKPLREIGKELGFER